jgi:hypothetical protein
MKYKIHFTITLVALILTSCQLFEKEKLTSKAQGQKEELQLVQQRNTLSQKNDLVLIDSSHNDFELMLWPKGKFTFSVANGFEGEAERILIKGKQTKQKVLNITQETKQDSTQFKANYSNEKASSITVKKNKISAGYNWFLLLVLPVLYGFYWLNKRYKFL